jgi:hypothetical protein
MAQLNSSPVTAGCCVQPAGSSTKAMARTTSAFEGLKKSLVAFVRCRRPLHSQYLHLPPMFGFSMLFVQLTKVNFSLKLYRTLRYLLLNEQSLHAEPYELTTSDKSAAGN